MFPQWLNKISIKCSHLIIIFSCKKRARLIENRNIIFHQSPSQSSFCSRIGNWRELWLVHFPRAGPDWPLIGWASDPASGVALTLRETKRAGTEWRQWGGGSENRAENKMLKNRMINQKWGKFFNDALWTGQNGKLSRPYPLAFFILQKKILNWFYKNHWFDLWQESFYSYFEVFFVERVSYS